MSTKIYFVSNYHFQQKEHESARDNSCDALAGKITGMLLDASDHAELREMLADGGTNLVLFF